MLYLLTGTDIDKRKKERDKLARSFSIDDAHIIKRDDTNISISEIEELATTTNLFGDKIVMILEDALSDDETREQIVKLVPLLSDSENHFIISETSLKKDILTKLSKKAIHSHSFDLKKEITPKDNSAFVFTDSFSAKDKKKSWMLYRELIEKGKDPREIIGLIFWAIKSMILSKSSTSADEAGLNPFVFRKAKSFSKNFKEGELENISKSIVDFYHKAQNGIVEWEEGLESLILKIL